MTKLMEWLAAAAAFFAVYFSIVCRQVQHPVFDQYMFAIQLSPLILLVLFGVSK